MISDTYVGYVFEKMMVVAVIISLYLKIGSILMHAIWPDRIKCTKWFWKYIHLFFLFSHLSRSSCTWTKNELVLFDRTLWFLHFSNIRHIFLLIANSTRFGLHFIHEKWKHSKIFASIHLQIEFKGGSFSKTNFWYCHYEIIWYR